MPSDDYFIRRFAAARDSGDMEAALQIWEEICTRNVDLVNSEIRRFTFPKTIIHLKEQDRGEAFTRGFSRMLKMGERFEGNTGAAFRAAVMTAVQRGCMDVGREEMAHEKKSRGSLDNRYDDGDGSRFDHLVEEYLRERELLSEEAEEADAESTRIIELVHWTIGRVKNVKYRTVLELTYIDKLSGEDIAERLSITLANVYQRRKRGQNELEKILRDHRP